MSTVPAQTEPAGSSLSGWSDPALYVRRGRDLRRTLSIWLTVALLSVVDTAVLQGLVAVAFNTDDLGAWLLAGGVTLGAAVAMRWAGRIHAGAGPQRAGDPYWQVLLLVAAWLLGGGTLAVLRVVAMSMHTDVSSMETTTNTIADVLAAVLFFALYVTSGILSFADGGDRNDVHTALELTLDRRDDVRQQRLTVEPQLTRLTLELARRRADIAHAPLMAEAERARSAALLKRSMGLMRTEISRLKADPSVTGICSVGHPGHPNHAASTDE